MNWQQLAKALDKRAEELGETGDELITSEDPDAAEARICFGAGSLVIATLSFAISDTLKAAEKAENEQYNGSTW